MKKKSVSLKKLDLGKKVISGLSSRQVKGGGTFSRCGEDWPGPPPFDQSLGCAGQSDYCTMDYCQTQQYQETCRCDTVYNASCDICD